MEDIIYKYSKACAFKQRKEFELFFLKISKYKKIVLFGAGSLGKCICKWLIDNDIEVFCFCDNDTSKENQYIYGNKKCIPFSEIERMKDDVYIIVCVGNHKCNREINLQLKDYEDVFRNPLGITIYFSQSFGVTNDVFLEKYLHTRDLFTDEYSKTLYDFLLELRLQDSVIDYPLDYMSKWCSPEQYVDRNLVDYEQIKTYLDCGAYTGDSLNSFIKVSGKAAHYYCVEMDETIFELLKNNVENYYRDYKDNIVLINVGVGEEKGEVKYNSDLTGGSNIDDDCGEYLANIVPIDQLGLDRNVDFLKMDIEGEEEHALLGARETINVSKPILAISMYHNIEQFLHIPQLIKSINCNYNLYLRHYKNTIDDTIIYAILTGDNKSVNNTN